MITKDFERWTLKDANKLHIFEKNNQNKNDNSFNLISPSFWRRERVTASYAENGKQGV